MGPGAVFRISIALVCVRSLYTPAYNLALNDQFSTLPRGVPALSVYCANFYFAIGLFAAAVAVNSVAMRWPPFSLKRSTAAQYLCDNRFRAIACASGLLAWCVASLALCGRTTICNSSEHGVMLVGSGKAACSN